ncbi:hypothetical protein [Frigoribacterium faeni]|uniref:HTH cro/C1-type domain-containing protein n=1 Tax=Frigoribacterium faeni TaxID=145483 RepID=A0A7W3JGZ8_9MICO|nr:hypothetical protein [Frigoribacterium faeni]MBA8812691.1 hypothetical protein [Frigoribacterium faeni]BFF13802.1 hypothetical protein GCM10025699_51050 [Microbacterium flavescens]GEK82294.1 hypothetical protein FFA01_06030 [Frigoribacterium faeni]
MNAPTPAAILRSVAYRLTIARKLRRAARAKYLHIADLRAIERQNDLTPGRLLMALAGLRLSTWDAVILQRVLGLNLSDVFATAGTTKAGAA